MLQYTPTTDTTETLNIEMLHPLERPSRFFQRLQITVKQAVTMRGAIAFWTVKPNFVVQNFAQLLAADESFICVDLHQPTNIDVLDELLQNVQCHDQNQQHVYLHLRELKGQTEEHGSNTNMPHDLLHLKTLLFDFTDGTAEIWVGSHNWTRRAMLGLNIEATVVLRVPQGGQLYNDTKQMLEQTRALCEPFAPRLKKFYKWLQGGMQPVPFFELEGPNASKLTNEEIKLFSLVEGEYASFGTIGRQIYLCVTDSNEGTEHIYNAALTTASDSAGDIASLGADLFTRRQRYVVRQERRLPYLCLPLQAAGVNPAERAKYCLSIRIGDKLPNTAKVFETPASKPWVETTDDPLLERLRTMGVDFLMDSPEYNSSVIDLLNRVTMKVPTPDVQEQLRPRKQRSLEDKRVLIEQELFSPKFVEMPLKREQKKSST